MTIAVCWKWVVPWGTDDRYGGVSPADEAALEWALRQGEALGDDVVVVSVGERAAETALRDAVARGANRALRIDLDSGADSAVVAAAVARVLGDERVSFVWCGDYSMDRGTGSVPAFVAGALGARQALGLVDVSFGDDGEVIAQRRLDGGRRERLRVLAPAVLSVEGGTALLRRAPLRATLAAQSAAVAVLSGVGGLGGPGSLVHGSAVHGQPRPYRPRPRVLAEPAGVTALDRVRSLLGPTSVGVGRADPVVLDPAAAAQRILESIAAWEERR
jgi:electron transfer flavoprotein beta subunit